MCTYKQSVPAFFSFSQVHRRLLHDDAFGVGEALNETYYNGTGVVVRGRHRVFLSPVEQAAQMHRTLAQSMYMAPVLAFAPVKLPDYLQCCRTTVSRRYIFSNVRQKTAPQNLIVPDVMITEGRLFFLIYTRPPARTLCLPSCFNSACARSSRDAGIFFLWYVYEAPVGSGTTEKPTCRSHYICQRLAETPLV